MTSVALGFIYLGVLLSIVNVINPINKRKVSVSIQLLSNIILFVGLIIEYFNVNRLIEKHDYAALLDTLPALSHNILVCIIIVIVLELAVIVMSRRYKTNNNEIG